MEPQSSEEAKSYLISQSSFESNLEEFMRSLDEAEDDASLWAAQLHENVVLEFPFAATTKIPTRLEGKVECLRYIQKWYDLFADFRIYELVIHRLEEQGAYVLEYKTKGFVASTARPYHQENIALIKVKDHKIIFIKEYWNPMHLSEAFGSELNFLDVKSIDPF